MTWTRSNLCSKPLLGVLWAHLSFNHFYVKLMINKRVKQGKLLSVCKIWPWSTKRKHKKKHSNKQRQTLIKQKSLNWFTFCFICIIIIIVNIIIFYLFTYLFICFFGFLIWISSIIIILCSVKDDCRSFVVQCSVTLLLLFFYGLLAFVTKFLVKGFYAGKFLSLTCFATRNNMKQRWQHFSCTYDRYKIS